jgi:hypothetical protein
MQEHELFETYELKGWQLSKRLYQVIGVSLVFNLVMFVFMAQANFLTGKTCDSPIASGVCSVLDTLYVGGLILDSDTDFVSKPYDRTEIGDADEITYINVGDYQPLKYPEGYFAPDPDQLIEPGTPIISSEIPGISTNPTDDLMNSTQILPPNKGAVVDGPLPDPLGNETQVKTKTPKDKVTKPKDNTTAKTDPKTTSDPVKPDEPNRKPFEDAADVINEQRANNQIDLTKNFEVVVDGLIKPDGKFDPKMTKFVKSVGDEKMVEAARAMIIAMGDSGFFKQLKENGIDRVNITLAQNDNEIYAILLSDLKTPEKAATAASGLNSLLQWAILFDNNGTKKLDENSKILVTNSTITAEAKTFKLNFKLPKLDGQAFIIQALEKRAEKKNKPLSSSGEVNNNNTTAVTAK